MHTRKTRSVTSNGMEDGIAMPNVHRRTFLKYAGMGSAILSAGTMLNSCSKGYGDGSGVSFGSGDVAVLNYAYALEQLEAAFYTQVVLTPYSGITDAEISLLTDIRNHEIAHREFFKIILSSSGIYNLQTDFSSIDFTSREKVLAAAQAFEDLGVAAYNGAAKYLTNAAYLELAGKIVSVEARHAGYIRDLVSMGSFASNADSNGLDYAKSPSDVISAVSIYIRTKINTNTLPQ